MSKRLTAEEAADYMAAIRDNNVAIRRYEVAHAIDACAIVVRENLVESEDQRRERFERWYRGDLESRRGIFNRPMHRDMRGVGEYRDNETETAWQAWQAALTYRDSE